MQLSEGVLDISGKAKVSPVSLVVRQTSTVFDWWWQGKLQPCLTDGGKANVNCVWLMVARQLLIMFEGWWQSKYGGKANVKHDWLMVANDNGDKVVGGKTGKLALLLVCRSVGQTFHLMLPLSTLQ